ncbi:MAG: 4,5-DOPA dioxygenase extradiol [Gallionellaceae bacterium]|nr:4,5-DOPA dioxygenase extradiol [Gallionellaceae bacterium]
MTTTMPVLFLGHGNPMNALEDNADSRFWRDLARQLPRPRAILAISAHWETRGIAVTAAARPQTIHDFHGFPASLAAFQYPAPGEPELAARIAGMLAPEPVALDTAWGLDHGAWSLLAHLYPAADIPVVQLGLDLGRDPAGHYHLARRLRPLRNEGVLVLASGNVVHDLRRMDWRQPDLEFDWARRFSDRVRDRLGAGDHGALIDYSDLTAEANQAVPTPEHFLPLLYAAALANEGEAPRFFNDRIEYGSIGMLSLGYGLGDPA